MEIGAKLKNARKKSGLTQEKAAEEIGVSRQSISNWENSRSYPDIVSVIKLSGLYSVSLDELLKEDKKMIYHLDESTNTVRSRKRLITLLEKGIYLLIWTLCVLVFWAFYGFAFWTENVNDSLISYAYPITVFYVILPVSAAVISAFISAGSSGKLKWLIAPIFGATFFFADFATFGAAWLSTYESVTFSAVMEVCEFPRIIIGTAASAVGIAAGILIKHSQIKKQMKQ